MDEEQELIEKANNIPKAPKGRRRYIDFMLTQKNPKQVEQPASVSPKKAEQPKKLERPKLPDPPPQPILQAAPS